MTRVISLVPLYACITWPGRPLPLYLPLLIQVDSKEKGFLKVVFPLLLDSVFPLVFTWRNGQMLPKCHVFIVIVS